MATPQTIAQIDASAKSAENAIATLQKQLQAEQRQIRRTAFLANRPLTADEQQRLDDIATAQTRLNDCLVELSYVTLQSLDNSTEVQQLRASMDRINQGLTADLDKLKRIEAISATVAKVADAVAKVAAQVAKLATGVA
jgi:hypothetical protein